MFTYPKFMVTSSRTFNRHIWAQSRINNALNSYKHKLQIQSFSTPIFHLFASLNMKISHRTTLLLIER